MSRLDGMVALITGAAAPMGIGQMTATRFAAEGAAVILTDLSVDDGRRAAGQIGERAIFIEHDVRSEASWASAVRKGVDRFGRLDILVNNAGITGGGTAQDIETLDLENWREVQRVNVEGVLLGCQAAIGQMKVEGGSIINISSMAALMATPTLPAYGASKAAVRQLTQTVALHCARKGYNIRCNSIHPGIIRTSILDDAMADEAMARLVSSIPTGVLGQPKDVAAAALYLASDDSRYVTGTRIIVDGGATMQ